MNRALIISFFLLTACSAANSGTEPSLAPRAAEAIDPRLPVAASEPVGTVDPQLASRLAALVSSVRAAVPAFNAREAEASRLAASAGPMASEGWIAAELALSRLVAEYGTTTRAAAEIDELASERLANRRWINSADREAIVAAAAEVAEISNRQSDAIERLKTQLAR